MGASELVASRGHPGPELARRFGLSATALGRHADAHLRQLMARAAGAEQDRGARLLERIGRLVADLERQAADCRDAGDREAYLRTARELIRALELLGRVTGELQAGTVQAQIVNLIGADVEKARAAVQLVESVEGMSEADLDQLAVKRLTEKGWRCMPPLAPDGLALGPARAS